MRPKNIKLCPKCYKFYKPLLKLTPNPDKYIKDKCDGCDAKSDLIMIFRAEDNI